MGARKVKTMGKRFAFQFQGDGKPGWFKASKGRTAKKAKRKREQQLDREANQ